MKSWKKQWKNELNETTPKLRPDVAAQPINVTAEQSNVETSLQTPAVRRKPFLYGLSSAVAAVLIVVVLCITLIPSSGSVYAFVVDINPSITVSADSDGNVTGIVASNADADVILSDTEAVKALIGKPVDEAVKWYVDRAAKFGYLDQDNVSAVRVSATDNGSKLLSKVSDSLESYFMERGAKVFVAADVVDLSALAERANLNVGGNLNAIVDYVQSAEILFRGRVSDGLSQDELKHTYKEYLTVDAFVKSVGGYLNGIIDVIEQNEKDIANLVSLNEQIKTHQGNPAVMLKDYWSVKKYYSDCGDPQFAELMSQMDKAVNDYNKAYGYDINSAWELETASYTYSSVSAQELRAVLDHFTADFLKLNLDWLSVIFQTVSADTPLIGLTTLPETAAEFVNKMRDIAAIERASREKQFEDAYNKVREQISQSDYYAFKQSLLSEYGSADELWNNLK